MNYPKVLQMLDAAYPSKDLEEVLHDRETRTENPWPKNSIEIIKDLMREYFPWRIDGDDIKYYDDLKID